MRYQYYIGISLPPELSTCLSGIQQALFDPSVAIPPLEPHITLLPPPAVQTIAPDILAARVREAAQPFLPLAITLTDVVTFDRHAVVLSVVSPQIRELQRILATLVPANTDEKRPFHPHITLSQAIRGKKLPSELIDAYRHELSASLPLAATVDHLTLFRWLRPRVYAAEVV
jgi:2'-5' RNA ligase